MGQGISTRVDLNSLTIETGGSFWGKRVDDRWKGFRNALAGLFCASLGSLDGLRTASPAQSFSPEGMLLDWGLPYQVRQVSLPSEYLTLFLKLLPCKSLSGIASLLNPHRLFDADWHDMGVHVLWRKEEAVELSLPSSLCPILAFIFGQGSRSVTMSNLTRVLSSNKL